MVKKFGFGEFLTDSGEWNGAILHRFFM